MTSILKRFFTNESGATAIEYGLIAGIMATVLITVLGTFSTSIGGVFTRISTAMSAT